MTSAKLWCYAKDELAERYNGPFSTREAAIVEALAEYPDQDSIAVAEAVYPDPALYAKSFSIYDMLEHLEDAASNDDIFSDDGPLFEVRHEARARAALAAALYDWAAEYIGIPRIFTARDPETIMREDWS